MEETQATGTGGNSKAATAVTLILLSCLFAVHLAHVATKRAHDDGCLYLQLPKNLVERGRWAVERADGLTDFDTKVAVGPATLLPIALSFKLFGVGLLQARITQALYFLAMLILAAHLASKLAGGWAAALTLAGFLLIPEIFLISTAAMGEVPGLVWLLAAFLICRKYSGERGSWAPLLLAGVATGFAYLAKCVYGYLAVGAWVLFFALASIRSKKIQLRELLAPLAGLAAVFLVYYGFIAAALGVAGAMKYALSIFDFARFARPQANIFAQVFYKFHLVRDWLSPAPALAALAWVFARTFDGKDSRWRETLPLGCFALAWLGWWFIANPINFYYHFFPAVVLLTILSAVFTTKVMEKVWRHDVRASFKICAAAMLVLVFLWPWGRLRGQVEVFQEQKRLAKEQRAMAEYVRRLGPETLVSGWGIFHNWDITFLADRPTWARPAEPTVPHKVEYLLMGPENIRVYEPGTLRPLAFNPHSHGCAEFVRERCGGKIFKQFGHFVLWKIKPLRQGLSGRSASRER